MVRSIQTPNHTYMDLATFFDYDLSRQQKLLLLLFSKQPKIIGKTRLQKLVFLLEKEFFTDSIFDFTPYKFGPYSSKLISAMDELLELGLIRERIEEFADPSIHITEYEISEYGLEKAGQLLDQVHPSKITQVEELIHQYGYQEMNSIMKYVYGNYPSFTENSIIKDSVLRH